MADAQGEKNLKPTVKRLRDARRRGQVARSRDLAAAAGLAGATAVLAALGGTLIGRLQMLVADALGHLDRVARTQPTPEDLSVLTVSSGAVAALVVGPVALAAAVAGVGISIAQGGLTMSLTPLQPDLKRLSPATGFARLAPSRAGLDTVKALVAATVLSVLAWKIGRQFAADAARFVGSGTAATGSYAWDLLLRLLWQSCAALIVIGAADYGLQRWRFMSSLKMTRHEVQEEARNEEGRPEVKARVRRIQRDMVRRRMLRATAHATVVVTNPTHYAVALEYRREKNPAPVVVAKGRDLIAARIREIAREHGVPIIENPSLARALFAGAEVGDSIPAPLFGAVAEVLAYLIRIRQLMV